MTNKDFEFVCKICCFGVIFRKQKPPEAAGDETLAFEEQKLWKTMEHEDFALSKRWKTMTNRDVEFFFGKYVLGGHFSKTKTTGGRRRRDPSFWGKSDVSKKHRIEEFSIFPSTISCETWRKLIVIMFPTFWAYQNPININLKISLCNFEVGWGGYYFYLFFKSLLGNVSIEK